MKISILKLHLEILGEDRQKLLSLVIPYTKKFVLGGGTALSLQIAHRKSFDFDFFCPSSIPPSLLVSISQTVNVESKSVDTTDELSFLTLNDIKITFLAYPFHRYYDLVEVDNGLKLFSVKEIAVQKAYTIGRRGEYRDCFDLYAILSGGLSNLSEIITGAEKIYGGLFSAKLFLEQLVYFEDMLDFTIIPVDKIQTLPKPEQVKHFFEKLVREYLWVVDSR